MYVEVQYTRTLFSVVVARSERRLNRNVVFYFRRAPDLKTTPGAAAAAAGGVKCVLYKHDHVLGDGYRES